MPATLPELKAACQGASADFLLQQLEASAEVPAALQAYNNQLRTELANRPATPTKPNGVTPPRSGNRADDTEADAGDFEQLVSEYRQRNPNVDRMTAVQTVALRHPKAHEAYLVGSQSNNRSRRLAEDKIALEA